MYKEADCNRQRQTTGKGEMDEKDREKEYENTEWMTERDREREREECWYSSGMGKLIERITANAALVTTNVRLRVPRHGQINSRDCLCLKLHTHSLLRRYSTDVRWITTHTHTSISQPCNSLTWSYKIIKELHNHAIKLNHFRLFFHIVHYKSILLQCINLKLK